jgi:hypothetical protein
LEDTTAMNNQLRTGADKQVLSGRGLILFILQ